MSEPNVITTLRQEVRDGTHFLYDRVGEVVCAASTIVQAYDLAIQRAEAAEAERDDARIEVSLANTQRGVLAAENVALLAERDALRNVEWLDVSVSVGSVTVPEAINALKLAGWKELKGSDGLSQAFDELWKCRRILVAPSTIDAALAVQP